MARDAQSKHQPHHSVDDAARGEWMDLRDQLEDLLDEVARQQNDLQDAADREAERQHAFGAARSAGRPETPPARSDRHNAALRNVRSAVQRFSDIEEASDMPSRSRHEIDAAIEQIRSSRAPRRPAGNWSQQDAFDQYDDERPALSRRHLADRRDYVSPRRRDDSALRADAVRFEKLDASIGEIADYLTRFDDLISSERLTSTHLGEIAVQLEQMTSIVEVLAGKVNERGHFETIERQISTLQSAVEHGNVTDMSGIEGRLNLLSESFERLSALQAEQNQQSASAYASLLEQGAKPQSNEHFAAIEDGVRNIYERLDTMSAGEMNAKNLQDGLRGIFNRIEQLEQNVASPQPLLQRLTNDITDLTETLKSAKAPVVSSVMSTRIDSLNERISSVENVSSQAPAPLDLSAIGSSLHETLEKALAPRLAEIETKIGGIANGMKNRAVKLETSPQLEQQIRQLTEKLEQTSADLAQLRESGLGGAVASDAPDINALADMVATRTQDVLAKSQQDNAGNTQKVLGQFESRLSDMLEKSGANTAPIDFSPLDKGIKSVNERLASLEKSINSGAMASQSSRQPLSATTPNPTPTAMDDKAEWDAINASQTDPAPANEALEVDASIAHKDAADEFEQFEQNPRVKSRLLPELQDTMPNAPTDDGPLNAPAFPDPRDVAPSGHRAEKSVPVPDMLRSSMGLGLDEHDDAQDESEDAPSLREISRGRDHGKSQTSSRDIPVDLTSVAPPPRPTSSFANEDAPESDFGASDQSDHSLRDIDVDQMDASAEVEDEFSYDEIGSDSRKEPSSFAQRFGRTQDGQDSSNAVSRSTFIAAARRAAQANAAPTEEKPSSSLFGKAFGRFKKSKQDETDPSAEHNDDTVTELDDLVAVDSPKDEPSADEPRRGRFHLRRAANKKAEQEAKMAETQPAELDNDLQDFEFDEDLDISTQSESFLTRHRRPILLGLATVAVSLLALNLVSQRLGEAAAPAVVEAAAPAVTQPEAETPAPASVDEGTVGSIEQIIDQTAVPDAEASVRMIDPSLFVDMPASLEAASLSNDLLSTNAVNQASIDAAVGPVELRDAAASGDVFAQFEVAAIYADGTAVPRDMQKAHNWYLKAAEQGFAPAMYLLANMLENGTGIEADPEQAAYWYERGALLGNRMSMHNLAAMNASGALGNQNFEIAAKWFERAAALGLTDSQFNLGMLNARGLGVPQDLNTSYKWFSIAARGGDRDAVQAKTDIARSLDPQVVGQLDGEIANWAPQALDIRANFAPLGTWSTNVDPGPSIESRDVIQRVQAALNKLGYDAGTADGLIGPKTRDAIGQFESATGMSPSNDINPRLLAVLGSQPV